MNSKARLFLSSFLGSTLALCFMAGVASAAVTPTVTTTIQNISNVNITTAPVGASVHAFTVVASSSASTSPIGTVDFNLYNNQNCSGAPAVQTGVALLSGQASSSNAILGVSGISYRAHYNGQTDIYTAADSACVIVATSTPPPPATTTPGTISGTVFNDLNRDGDQDAGEPGIAGVKVFLHQKATTTAKWWKRSKHRWYHTPVVMTATTDGSGNYLFANVQPGTYFIEQEELRGWKQKSHDRRVVLDETHPSLDVDFANVEKKRERDNDRSSWTREDWQKWWNERFEKFWEKKSNRNKDKDD